MWGNTLGHEDVDELGWRESGSRLCITISVHVGCAPAACADAVG